MISINEYFEGKVKSLGYGTAEGKATLGVMEEGTYEFGTAMHESILIIEGALEVLLPETINWQLFKKGESFEVSAGQSFKVKSNGQTAYLCKYR